MVAQLIHIALYAHAVNYQDCSHQPALLYIKNYCTVKSFKLFEKCLIYPALFLTFTIIHILTSELFTSKIYH